MARGPAIAIALFAIRAYQRLISPAFAGHCRFTPSCSEYAHDAIARHGWMGLLLAARRLLRCHPLGSSGYDPVPGTDGGAPRSGAGPRRNREPAPARTTPEAAR